MARILRAVTVLDFAAMHKTPVINAVGLTPRLLEHAPAAPDRALIEAQVLALGRGDASRWH